MAVAVAAHTVESIVAADPHRHDPASTAADCPHDGERQPRGHPGADQAAPGEVDQSALGVGGGERDGV